MTSSRPRHVVGSIFVSLALAMGLIAPAAPPVQAALPLVDDFEAGLPAGTDPNGIAVGFNTFEDPNPPTTVAIATTTTPPAPAPGVGPTVLRMDLNVVSYAGFTHSFENAAVNAWVTQDWSAYEGLSFWLYGNNSGTTLFVDVLDNRNPGSIRDDAERWSITLPDNFSGWRKIEIPFASLSRKEIGNGAPNDGLGLTEVHGWALGSITTPAPQTYYVDDAALYGVAPVRPLTVGFSTLNYNVTEGATATVTAKLSKPSSDPVTVEYASTIGTATANRDYVAPIAGILTFPPSVTQKSFTVQTIDDGKHQGERSVLVELSNPTGGAAMGLPPIARVNILDDELYDATLLDDFEKVPYLWWAGEKTRLANPEIADGSSMAMPDQGDWERVLQVSDQTNKKGPYAFGRTFPTAQDWSNPTDLSFWYYGRNEGTDITVNLANDQTGTAIPAAQWQLAWSDEFGTKRGAAPDTSSWANQVGDGTAYGIPGWGNDELQYYTEGGTNAATDGKGNLVITTRAADGSLQCNYGPCKYTSARLVSKDRFEVAYGRVEARVKVPKGAGLWPAFWMLGTDIDRVGWPQTGEIDIMEHVGRAPNQVFGTLHGPGYSGGASYGKVVDLGRPVADDFHTYAVEWQPDRIVWYLDGVPYFTATPSDPFLQGKEWVFNHPFYLLLNVAVGGNFGGTVDPATVFPNETVVDYVRLYQPAPSRATFSATFTDSFTGWQKVTIPLSSFEGETGASPDLTAVRSLGFEVPKGALGPVLLDQVRLEGGTPPPPATWSPITFDSSAVTYTLTGFGGADDSTVVVDPTDPANKVARVVKSATAELWAGTTVSTGPNFSVPTIPFTASATKMTVRVWSPDAGIQVRLKVEDAADPTKSVETEATVTTAAGWQTLTFDFANQAAGTAPLNLAYTYNKVSIFFNFGVTGATAGAKTYYFDDVAFGGA